jgi:hypothetical protein
VHLSKVFVYLVVDLSKVFLLLGDGCRRSRIDFLMLDQLILVIGMLKPEDPCFN